MAIDIIIEAKHEINKPKEMILLRNAIIMIAKPIHKERIIKIKGMMIHKAINFKNKVNILANKSTKLYLFL